jgi:hypothetical protein
LNALLFGNSRAGGIDVDKITGFHCYNMTYANGLPIEHYENLELMIYNGIIPELVLMGVDEGCIYETPESHKTELLRMPHPSPSETNTKGYIKFLLNYFNPRLLSALPIIITHNNDDEESYRAFFYANGGWVWESDSKFDWETARLVLPRRRTTRIDEVIKDIKKVIDICDENGIRLIIFTNPIHVFTYKNAVYNGYLDFLYRLSDITEFYNFSGINDVTANNDNYLETSHYKLVVGDMIADALFNNKVDAELLSQGFGRYVTKENRDGFIQMLKEQMR